MEIAKLFHDVITSPFGTIAIVWWNAPASPRIRRIILCGRKRADLLVRRIHPDSQVQTISQVDGLGEKIRRFLEGQAVAFDLSLMAMEECGEFQRKVLLAEYAIPRGRVSTYGRLAKHVGALGGGRAAGQALATNPFPIVIPCHRAVRADGGVGGYQGGAAMKRALLEMEGLKFSGDGRVILKNVYYD
jgi:methylated-DNA-[protein]-cysteine S-methyltransferase